jgi:hypothetical protein
MYFTKQQSKHKLHYHKYFIIFLVSNDVVVQILENDKSPHSKLHDANSADESSCREGYRGVMEVYTPPSSGTILFP